MIESLSMITMMSSSFLPIPSAQGNIIIQDIRTTYYYELRLVLIYNCNFEKYNAYLMDYIDEVSLCLDADFIVNNCPPLTLEEANRCFSTYKFQKKNYGF